MNAQDTLKVISICSATVGFISGIGSQLWKSSVEVDGQVKKRLTRAGWVLAAISLIGFSGTAASELLRINVRHNEELQARTKTEQEQLLREQETRWRDEMQRMLLATKADIETNIANTLKGFQQSQAQIADSKQSLLEATLRHTAEIVVASRPLTSLSFRWQFSSGNRGLWQTMKDGAAKVRKNSECEQGGSPIVPYDEMDYNAIILPLISHLAHTGKPRNAEDPNTVGVVSSPASSVEEQSCSDVATSPKDETFVVLIPLDESANAILSFGAIAADTTWYQDHERTAISAGFIKTSRKERRKGNSIPAFSSDLSPGTSGLSSYDLHWSLDPSTLWNVIDRRNTAIVPTAKLPKTLKVTIFHDARVLPFEQNNFGISWGSLWVPNEWAREYQNIDKGELAEMTFSVEVNGFQEMKYNYALKKVYTLRITDDYDDDINTGCTVFEFEAI
jgi:hypothetical protein